MSEISNGNLLRSWKEIAAYLGCDVRTCHRWEANHGMPVHRAEGGGHKSPVFAYKDELDNWFRGTFKNGHSNHKAGKARPWLKWALGGAAVLVLAGAYLILREKPVRRQPADFSIDGSTFIVLDKEKRELWRKDTGAEDLQSEEFYRGNFQIKHADQGNILPSLVMRDINGDGDTEVLFALKRERDQTGEGILFCYDRLGNELWTFKGGRELSCGPKRHSPDYRIAGFYVHDIDGDGQLETVVESFQAPDWPCQLALLDADGKVIGEFWNAGYLRDLTYQDINARRPRGAHRLRRQQRIQGRLPDGLRPAQHRREARPRAGITSVKTSARGRCSIMSPPRSSTSRRADGTPSKGSGWSRSPRTIGSGP